MFWRYLWLWGALAMLIGFNGLALAQPCYMDSDEQNPGDGVPVAWPDTATTPIKYKTFIEGGRIPDKAAVLAAIQAAFAAYEAITCTTLAFEYAGDATSLMTGGEEGFILVYFGHDAATWIYPAWAYYRFLKFKTAELGDINIGVIAMNAKDFDWTVGGAETGKIDIQTAVTQMLPNVLGYHASSDPPNASLSEIKFESEKRTLTPEQEDGARFSYFDSAEAGCTTPPPAPAICPSGTPVGDGGTPGDGTVTPPGDGTVTPPGDGTVPPPKKDGGTTNGGYDGSTSTGDGGTGNGQTEDDGCCRVSYARSTSLPFVILIGLALTLGICRRRFRR